MDIRDAIRAAAAHRDVPSARMEEIMDGLFRGDIPPVAVAGLLVALSMKGESAGELAAAVRSMRAHAPSAGQTWKLSGPWRPTPWPVSVVSHFALPTGPPASTARASRAASRRRPSASSVTTWRSASIFCATSPSGT